ncbi:MAG: ABC transporter permease [Anaerolineales bacterium]|nr:ABC transporter permease [Anaerolineales bacterium]
MTTRWRKVMADFWANKTRTSLMVVTIMVGVFAVGFNQNVGLLMNRDMDNDFLSANPSEATLYISPIDDDMIGIARQVPGVGDVQGISYADGQILLGERKVSIEFNSIKSFEDLQVNKLKPAYPGDTTMPVLGDGEVVFDRSAAVLGFKPGDTVTVELPDGKIRELTFVGYVHDVVTIAYNMMDQVAAYVTIDTVEWLGGTYNYNKVYISVAEDPTDQQHVADVAQAVADRLEDGGATVYFIFTFNPGHHFAWEITQGVIVVLGVLGWLTVFLSTFLVVNTVVALMAQHEKQIGIMKAIGGETRQILMMYLVLVLSFSAASFLIAVPLASWLGKVVLGGMADYLNFDQGHFAIFPEAVLQQALVAFLVPLLAALAPMCKTVRITVREALSDYGLGGEIKKSDRTVGKRLGLISRPVRISLRNAFRKRARLILTLTTLVLAGATFIAVMNLYGSFDQIMRDIEGYFLADVNVDFNRSYRYDKVAPMAMSVPGVKSVEGWMITNGSILSADESTSNELAIVAPPSNSNLIDPIVTAGRWLTPQDENAIVIGNHLLSVRPDLKIGDWVTIDLYGDETEWQIIGFYSIPGNIIPPLVYTNYEYLSKVVAQPGQVYSLRVITDENQKDAGSARILADRLQRVFDDGKIQVGMVQLASEWRAQQKAQTDVLVVFMLVMAILTAIVGGLGLMGTMSINTMERTREIGVMRAIGADNWAIQQIVLIEGLVVGLISWMASILFSIPITSFLVYGVGIAIFKAPLPFTFDSAGILIWLFGTLTLAALASALPARRASRLTIRDTLAYE